jgi:hypothetical protein
MALENGLGAKLGEVRLKSGAVLGLDPLVLAALPLTVRAVRNGGAMESLGADFAGNYLPRSTVFIAFRKARIY